MAPTGAKGWSWKLSAALCGLLLSLGILELGARTYAWVKKDIHFNEYGHQVVTAALREYLLLHGLMNSAATSPERLNN